MRRHVCIGARSLAGKAEETARQDQTPPRVATAPLYMGVYPDMDSVTSALMFIDDYENYLAVTEKEDAVLKTFVAVFPRTDVISQEDFAIRYWKYAQTLVDISSQTRPWDSKASPVPTDKDFELSLGGKAVFTTTLNPHSPRIARKFLYPAWVMNQTSQFDALRDRNDFARWQENIRAKDAAVDPSGIPNPILEDHGYASAAAQLPGSSVSPCPLVVPVETSSIEAAGARLLERARNEGMPLALLKELAGRCGQKGA